MTCYLNNMCKLSGAISLALLAFCLLRPVATSAQRDQGQPCASGLASCFSEESSTAAYANGGFTHTASVADPSRVVTMLIRGSHGGPLAHHWIEVEGSQGPVTIHFGPATIPFIDMGQISVLDSHGDLETEPRFHFLAEHYEYAKAPGSGQIFGKPLKLTLAQADALIQKERHRRFIGPYIPIFHDCRTFVCSVQASVQGKFTLPCYLLLKGYW